MPFRILQEEIDGYVAAISRSSQVPKFIGNALVSPANLCMLLSALTEPAMLLAAAKRGCPINGIGAVNVRNRFELPRPDLFFADMSGPLETLLSMQNALVTATSGTKPVAVKRDLEYYIKVELLVPDNRLDGHPTAFRQIFTILELVTRGRPRIQTQARCSRSDFAAVSDATDAAPLATAALSMEANAPSKWARVCKDCNPIHTSGIVARLLGIPNRIAHGNHVVARALACLEDMGEEVGGETVLKPIYMTASFLRPVVVPSELRCEWFTTSNRDIPSEMSIVQQNKVATRVHVGFLNPPRRHI